MTRTTHPPKRSRRPRKKLGLPDQPLLQDNDARLAEVRASATAAALQRRNNDGTFAKKNPVTLLEPPQTATESEVSPTKTVRTVVATEKSTPPVHLKEPKVAATKGPPSTGTAKPKPLRLARRQSPKRVSGLGRPRGLYQVAILVFFVLFASMFTMMYRLY